MLSKRGALVARVVDVCGQVLLGGLIAGFFGACWLVEQLLFVAVLLLFVCGGAVLIGYFVSVGVHLAGIV
jgi:hypothetical protein